MSMPEETKKYITESQENISQTKYSTMHLKCLNTNDLNIDLLMRKHLIAYVV